MSGYDGMMSSTTRRTLLAGVATGMGTLAGCLGGDSGGGDLPAPKKGSGDAPVTLAVYEDFACPHCRAYNAEGWPQIRSAYVESGDLLYEHRDFPIPVLDPGSWRAHNAARAVQDREGEEGFWAFAQAVFENQPDLGDDDLALYERLGNDLGFDGDAIRSDAADRAYDDVVEADRSEGRDLGVSSTPTFAVNGEIVATGFGSGTTEAVEQAIEDATSANG